MLQRAKDDHRRRELFCNIMQTVGSRPGAHRAEFRPRCRRETARLFQEAFSLRASISHPLSVHATWANRSGSRVHHDDNGIRAQLRGPAQTERQPICCARSAVVADDDRPLVCIHCAPSGGVFVLMPVRVVLSGEEAVLAVRHPHA
jgi:hypothetical protein